MFKMPLFLRKLKVKYSISPSKDDKIFVVDALINAMEKMKSEKEESYALLAMGEIEYPLIYTCTLARRTFGPAWKTWLGSVWVTCLGKPDGEMLWRKSKWAKFVGVDTNSHDLRIIALKRVREMIKSGELQ